ncbi:hypothetical protein ACOMHN_035145 [Nucella lapillus]
MEFARNSLDLDPWPQRVPLTTYLTRKIGIVGGWATSNAIFVAKFDGVQWVAVTAYPYFGGKVWYQCPQEQEITPPRSWRDSTPPPRSSWTECPPRSSWREGTPPPPSPKRKARKRSLPPPTCSSWRESTSPPRSPWRESTPPARSSWRQRTLPPRGQKEYAPPPRAWRQKRERSPLVPYQTQSPHKRPRSTNSGWDREEDRSSTDPREKSRHRPDPQQTRGRSPAIAQILNRPAGEVPIPPSVRGCRCTHTNRRPGPTWRR